MGAVTAGPPELQAQVVEWVLAGVRAAWADPAWQAHLAGPQAFISQYIRVESDGAGGYQVGAAALTVFQRRRVLTRRLAGHARAGRTLGMLGRADAAPPAPPLPPPQAGGQGERWIMYHQCHLAERCFRTMRTVASPGGAHPLSPHAGAPGGALLGGRRACALPWTCRTLGAGAHKPAVP